MGTKTKAPVTARRPIQVPVEKKAGKVLFWVEPRALIADDLQSNCRSKLHKVF